MSTWNRGIFGYLYVSYRRFRNYCHQNYCLALGFYLFCFTRNWQTEEDETIFSLLISSRKRVSINIKLLSAFLRQNSERLKIWFWLCRKQFISLYIITVFSIKWWNLWEHVRVGNYPGFKDRRENESNSFIREWIGK